MNRKKINIEKVERLKGKIIFCTECGDELEQFGIEGEPLDLKKIKERHERCRTTGKFKGDKCAMLFIAQQNEELFTSGEED